MDTDTDDTLLTMRGAMTYAASYLEAKATQQQYLDMCEDSGLVFMLPSLLNSYSGE